MSRKTKLSIRGRSKKTPAKKPTTLGRIKKIKKKPTKEFTYVETKKPVSVGEVDPFEITANVTPAYEKNKDSKTLIGTSEGIGQLEGSKGVLESISRLRRKVRDEGEFEKDRVESLSELEQIWQERMPQITPSLNTNEEVIANTESKYINSYIDKKLDEIITKGFKPVYTGREILYAVHEKQERLFDELVFDITETMLYSIMAKARKKQSQSPISFDEFVFLSIARSDFSICKESFDFAFVSNPKTHVKFVDEEMDTLAVASMEEEEDSSGIDSITQLFFNVFKLKNEVRENINVPSPESIIKLEV